MATDRSATVDPRVAAGLARVSARLRGAQSRIGFPAAGDIDWAPLADIFTRGLLNNLGDPFVDGLYPAHTKDLERQVVEILADLFRAPPHDRWGHVTGGATEAILYGLWLARRLHPGAVVYHSSAAHPGVSKAVDLLAMRSVVLRADRSGELGYRDLARQVGARRDRPVVVVANIGTTWTEAYDDVRRITHTLDGLSIPTGRRLVVADAALSGIPLALLDPTDRPGFDLTDGADVVIVSGHKFLATPMPCAVVITRASLITGTPTAGGPVAYTGSPDTTISSSRNGHAALAIWYALTVVGRDGLAARAGQARDLAGYLHHRLQELGWPAWRNPHAMTVTLAAPRDAVRARWGLAALGRVSHIVCVPGLTRQQVDAFLSDLAACHTVQPPTMQPATVDMQTATADAPPSSTVDGSQPSTVDTPPATGDTVAGNGKRRPPRARRAPTTTPAAAAAGTDRSGVAG